MKNKFHTANDAFVYFYNLIKNTGTDRNNTLTLFNCGFYIMKPQKNQITTNWRNWSYNYAKREWKWYLSGNPSVSEIKKYAPIWDKMHKGDNIVNSNYGYQWNRGLQLDYIINELKIDKNSRRAVISIYDGKEHDIYQKDTPCTNSIHFQIIENKVCMTVNMRSNDLWYGFCNDQYCFSELQSLIAYKLKLKVGWYYHFSSNLHLYKEFV